MKVKKFFGLILLLVSFSAFAADPAPMAMMKSISDRMLGELDKNIGRIKTDKHLVYSLVNRILLPHFDLTNMSRAVVGRDYWQQASNATQQQFIKEFTRYVISTYSAALCSYDGETVKFYPIRGQVGDRVKINSDLVLKSGPAIQLQYSLAKASSEWLIYDFSVDGVSIVKNYNSQFAGTLRQVGLDGLVKEIQRRNID